jgi:hypothetical protein
MENAEGLGSYPAPVIAPCIGFILDHFILSSDQRNTIQTLVQSMSIAGSDL